VVVVAVLACLLVPAAAVVGARRNRVLRWLSPVVLCYVAGIVLGNVGVVPPGSAASEATDAITAATVVLAIPLLLLGADVRAWLRLARPTIVSFGFAVVAIVVVVVAANLLSLGAAAEDGRVAGMVVGVYTGGTANMAAIGRATGVPEATFVALNAADVLASSVYLLALLTFLPRLLRRVLPAYVPASSGQDGAPAGAGGVPDEAEAAADEWARPPTPAILRALGAALLVVLPSALLAWLVAAAGAAPEVAVLDSDAFATALVLAITTLGLAGSFVPRLRALEGTYVVGQYLFLVFAVAIGTLANVAELGRSLTSVLPYLAAALAAAAFLHVLLARLAGIDADTVVITSTAAVFGPPFVGPVAAAIGNREVVVAGLTTGVIGLAIGNYVGLAVARMLGG
jgi:uncharacterized membrane protein